MTDASPLHDPRGFARRVGAWIDASPTPYHAVATAAAQLDAAGFTRLDRTAPWPAAQVDRAYVAEGGALVAWAAGPEAPPAASFDLVGAHTDSPGLRIRPQPDTGRAGWRQLAVEVYGGALLNSWLDRDLGLAGRVAVRSNDGVPEVRLVRVDEPVLKVPQLAIHLDRGVVDQGLVLNKQQHLTPVWGLGPPDPGRFVRFLAERLGVAADEVLGWDLLVHDLTGAALVGPDEELLAAARLDDQLSCACAVEALLARDEGAATVGVVSLFDHEEVGSSSATGADGGLLAGVLERVVHARGGDREAFLRALGASRCASADGAHATHPNYAERHEPLHWVLPDGGPVVKVNVNQRYATDAATQAAFEAVCDHVRVPVQRFTSRGDMPCGSTIGPVTAARLAMPTVDVGVAQLAMHSARELCGATDPARFTAVLTAWLSGALR